MNTQWSPLDSIKLAIIRSCEITCIHVAILNLDNIKRRWKKHMVHLSAMTIMSEWLQSWKKKQY